MFLRPQSPGQDIGFLKRKAKASKTKHTTNAHTNRSFPTFIQLNSTLIPLL